MLEKLGKYKFLKRNKLGDFIPIGKSNCVAMTHPQILNYYNSKIHGILNYFNFCHNRMNLWSIIRFLKYSCALSLAKKFKLKTLAKTFRKFGPDLAFRNDTGKKFKIFRPKNLRMLSMDQRFNLKDDIDIDKILHKTWSGSMTLSQLDEPCVICGTLDNIEMHHVRSVKNVRVKVHTYAQWEGAFRRKSILLCSGHHVALHSGKLSRGDIKKLAQYKKKASRWKKKT